MNLTKWMALRVVVWGLAVGPVVLPAEAAAQQRKNPVVAVQKQDSNGDGRVSRDEWTRSPAAFGRIDADADGYITVQEYGDFLGVPVPGGGTPAKKAVSAPRTNSGAAMALVDAPTRVSIPISGGRTLDGTLHPASTGRPSPGVIILHTAYMQVEPGDTAFAEAISAEGFTALTLNFIHPGHQPKIWNPRITKDLKNVAAWLSQRPEVGGKPIGAAGFSLGSHALLLAARDPSIKAVVVYYGAFDPNLLPGKVTLPPSVPVPLKVAGNVTVPVLLLHGDDDDEVPVAQAVEMKDRLEAAGTTVDLVRYPGAYHRFDRGATPSMSGDTNKHGHVYRVDAAARSDALRRSIDWFTQHLGG